MLRVHWKIWASIGGLFLIYLLLALIRIGVPSIANPGLLIVFCVNALLAIALYLFLRVYFVRAKNIEISERTEQYLLTKARRITPELVKGHFKIVSVIGGLGLLLSGVPCLLSAVL